MKICNIKRVIEFCDKHNMQDISVKRNRLISPYEKNPVFYSVYASSEFHKSTLKLDIYSDDTITIEKTDRLNIEDEPSRAE